VKKKLCFKCIIDRANAGIDNQQLNIVVKWLTFLLHIQEVLNSSAANGIRHKFFPETLASYIFIFRYIIAAVKRYTSML
jgi:hypothetical protein